LPPLEKTTPLAEPSNATSSVPPLIVVATAAVPGAYLAAATRAKRLNDGPMLEALKRLKGATIHLPGRLKDRPDRDRLALRFERFKSAA